MEKIKHVGDELHEYTEKLVISFADIAQYKKVQNNLNKSGQKFREFSEDDVYKIAAGLKILNKKWGLTISTCAEAKNLQAEYGITANKCIDDILMIKLFPNDRALMEFLGVFGQMSIDEVDERGKISTKLKDKGQRKECGCIISKDIGIYNTCGHLCVYCYANTSADKAC